MTEQSITVLHVDDEPDFADMTGTFLERENDQIGVVTAQSASEGLDVLQDTDVDCIVSDYDMPETNGLELLEIVREDHPDLPFILFTGKGSEEIASEAVSAGATDYLQKEGGTDQYTLLANRLENAVQKYRAERERGIGFRAMDAASEGISIVEPDGTFSYTNPAFASVFEYDGGALIGEHWTVLYPDDEAKRLANDIIPAVQEIGYWSGETVRETVDGDRVVTDHRLSATDQGRLICTARDVSEERRRQRALLERGEQFDLLLDADDERAIVRLDHEGYVTRWNTAANRVMGFEAEEIVGRHFSTLFPPDARNDDVPAHLLERAKAEGSISVDGVRVRDDGSQFRAEETIVAVDDGEGTVRGFRVVTRDRGEQRVTQ